MYHVRVRRAPGRGGDPLSEEQPPYHRDAPDAGFYEAVLVGDVPTERWTHRAYLRLLYWLLREHQDAAAAAAEEALTHYDRGEDGGQQLHRQVHRTAIHAWLRLLDVAGARQHAGEFASFLDDHPAFLDPGYLRRYYSADRRYSDRARTAVLEPDRAPLPDAPADLDHHAPRRPMPPELPGSSGEIAWLVLGGLGMWLASAPQPVVWLWLILSLLVMLAGNAEPDVPTVRRLTEDDLVDGPALLDTRPVHLDASEAECPFCADALRGGTLVACARCQTPHHSDCWQAGGGCTTFGCGAGEGEARRARLVG